MFRSGATSELIFAAKWPHSFVISDLHFTKTSVTYSEVRWCICKFRDMWYCCLLARKFSETLKLSRSLFSLIHTHHGDNQRDRRKKNNGKDRHHQKPTTALRHWTSWTSPKLPYDYVEVRKILLVKRTYFGVVLLPLLFSSAWVKF